MGNESSTNAFNTGSFRRKRGPRFDSARARFSQSQVKFLERTFNDLSSRNPQKQDEPMIDKVTFLRVFALPGMLGERLFAVFDTKKKESIDWEDFVCGVSILVCGTLEEKIGFLFKMYDLAGTGMIARAELELMMNSAVFAIWSIFEQTLDPKLGSDGAAEDDPELRQKLADKAKGLIDSAFDELGDSETEKLSLREFSRWVQKHPEHIEVIEAFFNVPTGTSDFESSSRQSSDTSQLVLPDTKGQTLPARISRRLSASSSWRGRKQRKNVFLEDVFRSPKESFSQDDSGSVKRKSRFSRPKLSILSRSVSPSGAKTLPAIRIDGIRRSHRHKPEPKANVVCRICSSSFEIYFCYSCGSLLEDGLDSCKQCGIIFITKELKFCLTCGFDLSLNDSEVPIEPPKLRGSAISRQKRAVSPIPSFESELEGFLFKYGAKLNIATKRWFALRDGFLYYFHNPNDKKPTGVIFLEGCFVEEIPVDEKHTKYGFEILMPEGKGPSRKLYANTAEDRDNWVKAIRSSAQVYSLEDYYIMGKEVGKGKFSTVHECHHRTSGKKYAVKVIDKLQLSDKDRESLRTEIAILQLINHPNVIHLKNIFEDRQKICIVMGFVEGGDLFDRIAERRRFNEFKARSIIQNILKTVQYLHQYGIVHRDLKPENIMVVSKHDDSAIQIADFGLSKFASPEEVMNLPCGTLAYVAPEVLQMEGYGKEVDVWSIGIILYVLLRGRLPFDGKKKRKVIEKTLSGKLYFSGDPVWESTSSNAIDLIKKLLHVDPKRRITIEEALQHPWFSMELDPKFNIPLSSRRALREESGQP